MNDIITRNPYRVLGVCANAPVKERVANESKMRAFLEVGRDVSFPLDLCDVLGPVERTKESVAQAVQSLALPHEQELFGRFWFVDATPIDNIALSHLRAGDAQMAGEMWGKQDNSSSLQNRMVLALAQGRTAEAIGYAERLPQSDGAFLQALREAVGTEALLRHSTRDDWQDQVRQAVAQPLVDSIEAAIAVAKRAKGSEGNRQAGQQLISQTRESIAELRRMLGTDDVRYQTIADKLGDTILSCAIAFYNDGDDEILAYEARDMQRYAQTIVVSDYKKQRCQENGDIFDEIIDHLPPREVATEVKELAKALRQYDLKPDTIDSALWLVDTTKASLAAMRSKLGRTHSVYLKWSTRIARSAEQDVIKEVNATMDSWLRIEETLRSSLSAIYIIGKMDMEADYRAQFNKNCETLRSICRSRGESLYGSGSSTPSRSPTSTPAPQATKKTATTSSNDTSYSSSMGLGCLIFAVLFGIVYLAVRCSDSDSESSTSKTTAVTTATTTTDSYEEEEDEIDYEQIEEENRRREEEARRQQEEEERRRKEEEERNKWNNNRLSTGSRPYYSIYGSPTIGDNYMQFKTASDHDYVVIIKWAGTHDVVNHAYIRGGDTHTLYVPNGIFDVFFYSGNGWNPTKVKDRVRGGFQNNESISKDLNVSLYEEYLTYTLRPVPNGNLHLSSASAEQAF